MVPGTSVGVPAMRGRPDVEAVLRAAAAEGGAKATVGVYAGGPPGLMQAVHLAVCRLNGEGARYELHNESVEL